MDTPNRVLHVIDSMNLGGAETMIMNIFRSLDHTKIQFDFLVNVPEECYYEKELKSFGANVYHTVQKSKNPIKFSVDLYRLLKCGNYTAVHVHASNAMAAIPILVTRIAGVKKRIVHSHNSNNTGNRALHNVMRPILNIIATNKFSCSDKASEWMYGKKKSDAVIINNPIDCDCFRFDDKIRKKMRNSLGLNNKTVYVHVGRFNTQKNHSFLIDLFYEIYKQNKNSILLLIGEGELRSQIEERIEYLKLKDAVYLLGIRDDIYNILQASDAFIFPSLYEGLPLTLVEAQASGLRCYISDVISDMIDITDLIKRIPLETLASDWAKIITEDWNTGVIRENYAAIVGINYDANQVSKQLLSYYTERAI